MSEKFRLDRKIGIQNTFYTKCINVIIDSIGPSIILRSLVDIDIIYTCMHTIKFILLFESVYLLTVEIYSIMYT